MYKIILTQRALKDLERIDKETQRRIAVKLKEYANNPLIHAKQSARRLANTD